MNLTKMACMNKKNPIKNSLETSDKVKNSCKKTRFCFIRICYCTTCLCLDTSLSFLRLYTLLGDISHKAAFNMLC